MLEERVHHIEYTPPSPELYYQPTGKEIQPKPVGEEAGRIVFQYYPMSAVNYVGFINFYLETAQKKMVFNEMRVFKKLINLNLSLVGQA